MNGYHDIINQQFKPSNDGVGVESRSLFEGLVALPTLHRESLPAASSSKSDFAFYLVEDMNRDRFDFDDNDWEELKRLYLYHCVDCGGHESDVGTLQMDHIVPFSKGGAKTIDNIQPLCKACNCSKSNYFPIDYRDSIFGWSRKLHDEIFKDDMSVRFFINKTLYLRRIPLDNQDDELFEYLMKLVTFHWRLDKRQFKIVEKITSEWMGLKR